MPIIPLPWAKAPAQQRLPPSPKALHYTAAQCNCVAKADPSPKCFPCDMCPLCARHVGQLCADCQRDSGEDAPTVEDARAEMEFGEVKALGGGARRSLEGMLEGVPALEGSAGRVPGGRRQGFQCWKGPLEGAARRGFRR